MAESPWVIDVDQDAFQTQVVERSRSVPVVIDFWAPWCGPCRALGPLLEQLAEEGNGAFVLAKVNVDENPELAGHFGVSGIPAVFGVRDERVIDQFTGLMPEADIRQFISGLAPSALEKLLEVAVALEESDPAAAEVAYRSALATDSKSQLVRVALARLLLNEPGREAEAAALLHGVESGVESAEADRLRRILKLREAAHSDEDLASAQAAVSASSGSAEAYLRLGAVLAARGNYSDALESLLAAAERDKSLAGGTVRELMVTVFHVIGLRSPEADAYRDRLRSLLY